MSVEKKVLTLLLLLVITFLNCTNNFSSGEDIDQSLFFIDKYCSFFASENSVWSQSIPARKVDSVNLSSNRLLVPPQSMIILKMGSLYSLISGEQKVDTLQPSYTVDSVSVKIYYSSFESRFGSLISWQIASTAGVRTIIDNRETILGSNRRVNKGLEEGLAFWLSYSPAITQKIKLCEPSMSTAATLFILKHYFSNGQVVSDTLSNASAHPLIWM